VIGEPIDPVRVRAEVVGGPTTLAAVATGDPVVVAGPSPREAPVAPPAAAPVSVPARPLRPTQPTSPGNPTRPPASPNRVTAASAARPPAPTSATTPVTPPATTPATTPVTTPVTPPATTPPTVTAPTSGTTPPTLVVPAPVVPSAAPAASAPPRTDRPRRPTRSTRTAATAPPSTGPVPRQVSGFDGRTITLGVIGTSTNPSWSNVSRAITAGIEARVAAINRRGGIGGRYQVRLVVRDADYDVATTLSEIQGTAEQVVGYVSVLGTPNVEAAVPVLRERSLLASPASQEARWAGERHLLPVFNTYQSQAVNGVAYFLAQPGNADALVCGASIATSFGDAGTEGIRTAQAQLGFNLGPVVQLAPADTNPVRALNDLRAAGCRAVMTTVSPLQLLPLVVGGSRVGFTPRWIVMGAGFTDRLVTQQTSQLLESVVWVVGDGSQWGDANTPGMARLAQDLLAADHRYWTENPDVGLSFGYVQMRTWEAVLEAAVAAGDLSRPAVLAARDRTGPLDLEGLGAPIDYRRLPSVSDPTATVFAVDGSYRNSIRVLALGYRASAALDAAARSSSAR
jgi:ABC-type branched-subunit amino acid transport system substrate-binding protein